MDTIELILHISRGKVYQRESWLRNVSMGLVCVLVVLGGMVSRWADPTNFHDGDTYRSTPLLYKLTADGWQTVDLPADCDCDYPRFFTGDDGDVWLVTLDSRIFRYQEGAWSLFSDEAFATDDEDVVYFSSAAGEQLWAARGRDVIVYDGENLTTFPDVLVLRDYVNGIVTTPERVVAFGYLSIAIQTNGEWSTYRYEDVLPNHSFGDYDDDASVTIVSDPEGTLWLMDAGLYRSENGSDWTLVRSFTEDEQYIAALIGVDEQSAWVSFADSIERIGTDGETIQTFDFADIGISENAYIYRGDVSGQNVIVVSDADSALFIYDGIVWQRLEPSLSGGGYLSTVDFGSDGVLWASYIATSTNWQNYAWLLSSPLLILFGTIGGVIGVVLLPAADLLLRYVPKWMSARRRWYEAQQVLDVLGLPQPEKRRDPYQFRYGIIGGVVSVLWTGALILLAVTSLTAYEEVDGLYNQLSSQTPVVSMGLVAVGAYLLARLLETRRIQGNRTFQQLYRWTLEGRFEDALQSAVQPGKDDKPVIVEPFLRIYTLMTMGRYEEAQAAIQEFLPQLRSMTPEASAYVLAYQSELLVAQGKYDESLKWTRASLMLSPNTASYYADLANILLHMGGDSEIVLAVARTGRDFIRRPLLRWDFMSQVHETSAAEVELQYAFVLARAGRCDEALSLAAEALLNEPENLPVLAASIRLNAAKVLLNCGDHEGARKHFQAAVAFSSTSTSGVRAQQALTKMDGQASESSNAT